MREENEAWDLREEREIAADRGTRCREGGGRSERKVLWMRLKQSGRERGERRNAGGMGRKSARSAEDELSDLASDCD